MCEWLTKLFTGTIERPSPSDIIPKGNITVVDWEDTAQIIIDYFKPLNIPFTKSPKVLSIMVIPDTNSMDGVMDYGHNPLYIQPADRKNHAIMVDWLANEFKLGIETGWKQGGANDCVYRIPADFNLPPLIYAIHRIHKIGYDDKGRYWIFKGINNAVPDPYRARDENILWLNTGVIY